MGSNMLQYMMPCIQNCIIKINTNINHLTF